MKTFTSAPHSTLQVETVCSNDEKRSGLRLEQIALIGSLWLIINPILVIGPGYGKGPGPGVFGFVRSLVRRRHHASMGNYKPFIVCVFKKDEH